jgi:hypothetical protein
VESCFGAYPQGVRWFCKGRCGFKSFFFRIEIFFCAAWIFVQEQLKRIVEICDVLSGRRIALDFFPNVAESQLEQMPVTGEL